MIVYQGPISAVGSNVAYESRPFRGGKFQSMPIRVFGVADEYACAVAGNFNAVATLAVAALAPGHRGLIRVHPAPLAQLHLGYTT